MSSCAATSRQIAGAAAAASGCRLARQPRATARRLPPPPPATARHASEAAQREREPRPVNAPGSFYVDRTCIDCDTCRWMAPATFGRAADGMSYVHQQPGSSEDRHAALQALLACPTFSIHAADRQRGELQAAQQSFPLFIPGCPSCFHCGFADERSFGATSYFIRRPQGNILVDVPRWTPLLAQRLAALGGVRWMFLTHRDDVGAHERWAQHFGATRIIHRLEANRRQGTDRCEVQLEGAGPWGLPDAAPHASGAGEGEDVQLVFTPGHTAGCVSLLYRPEAALFTGDHLAYSARLGRLTMFRAYNWHSVEQQLLSVAALRGLPFLHVLPGHGRRTAFASEAEREAQLAALLEAEGYKG